MELLPLLTILGMGVVTYITRIGGDLLMRNRTLGPRMTAALNAVPPAVLTAVIAPSVLSAGLAEAIAGAVTLIVAFRLPLLVTIITGVATIALIRALI
ncbi:MAG: AzlD family protein [Hyphomicrobiales bacterium]|nr:AzlD family protein [Hyphomicrobiales bacterium]